MRRLGLVLLFLVGVGVGWNLLLAWLLGAEIAITRYVECLTR